MMNRIRYPLLFIASVILLTAATVISYGRIGATVTRDNAPKRWPGNQQPEHAQVSIPTRADYARYAADDSAWRVQNARQYSVDELRARGDGTRSDKEILEDRVYTLTRRGDRRGAVVALESWVRSHPHDRSALLSLARLLRETGNTNAAIARYRQLLSDE